VSGFGELIKQGLKSATKAMVKKGSTVSSKKIDNGVVEKVNPYAKTVTIQSKDGKLRETVKAEEVTVQPVRRRTRDESVFLKPDEAYTPRNIEDIPKNELAGMSDGEIRRRLIASDLQSYDDLVRFAGSDSDIDKRLRRISYNQVPGLRKTAEQRKEQANKFRQAKQEAAEAKRVQELEEQKVAKQAAKDAEEIKRRRQAPNPKDPAFKGPMGLDMQKFLTARKNYDANKDKPALKNNPNATFWKRGGLVNTNKKQYRTVTNRFSDRMLPNKKRTTRIY
tara:strand:+ start:88 stop:924 length:837 start_codon:yes stop_codon:yes gene_type:complete